MQVASALASLCIGLSALYLGWELIAGWRQVRTQGHNLGHQATLQYGHPHQPAPPPGWHVYFLVPALNEAEVIANTIRCLTGGSNSTVVVIDDGSDDATGALAASAADDTVHILRRDLPNARQGKGAALNQAYRWLLDDVRSNATDPSTVIVCVMDADGRLSDGALADVLPAFDNPKVGALQLSVRIRNRQKFLTQYQDYLFWSMAAVTQFGRISTGSVSLGGNGQFTRLSALMELGDVPWSNSLTEDLDLGLRIAMAGWQSTSAAGAAVDQQAVGTLDRLIRQRTRWYQGHMLSGARIKSIWLSPDLPHLRALELIAYLLCPWVLDLPWAILFHICLFGMVTGSTTNLFPAASVIGVPMSVAFWYLIAFSPSILTGLLYHRRDRSIPILKALMFSHATVAMNYVSFICVWKAAFRIITRRTTAWAKTTRENEGGRPILTPVPAFASAGFPLPGLTVPMPSFALGTNAPGAAFFGPAQAPDTVGTGPAFASQNQGWMPASADATRATAVDDLTNLPLLTMGTEAAAAAFFDAPRDAVQEAEAAIAFGPEGSRDLQIVAGAVAGPSQPPGAVRDATPTVQLVRPIWGSGAKQATQESDTVDAQTSTAPASRSTGSSAAALWSDPAAPVVAALNWPQAARVEAATSVAWAHLARLANAEPEAERAFRSTVDVLVGAGAEDALLDLFAVHPGRPPFEVVVVRIDPGTPSGRTCEIFHGPIAGLRGLCEVPVGEAALLVTCDGEAERLVASISTAGEIRFSAPDPTSVDAGYQTELVLDAWHRQLTEVLGEPGDGLAERSSTEVIQLRTRLTVLEGRVDQLTDLLDELTLAGAAGREERSWAS